MAVKILIADDEPDLEPLIRQRFRRQVRDGRYAFSFAADGAEALRHLQADPDILVVLTDLNMPVMDGLEFLDRHAASGHPAQTVVVSAYGDLANIRLAMNRGAHDFLTKPIDFQDFEATLEKTIRHAEYLRGARRTQLELAAIQRELAVAARIQQSILPGKFPPFPERGELDIHATMQAARDIGGDLFDFFWLDSDRLGLVIGDVSGKGVPAALFMAMSRSLLRALAGRGLSPGECLTELNGNLCRDNDMALFVTAVYAILNTATGEVHYSLGGHPPPLVVRPGGVGPLGEAGGTVIGVIEGAEYETGTACLEPGSALVLFTDGVTEALAPGGGQFGTERLAELLGRAGPDSSEKIVTGLVEAVRAFEGSNPASDDLTALVVRYHGPHRVGVTTVAD